jgi:hypothetical protein
MAAIIRIAVATLLRHFHYMSNHKPLLLLLASNSYNPLMYVILDSYHYHTWKCISSLEVKTES